MKVLIRSVGIGDDAEEFEGVLRFAGDRIEIAYDVEEMPCVYKGRQEGDGHYRLTCEQNRGKATLHCFPSSPNEYVGEWSEVWDGYGYTGFWTIEPYE